MSRDEHRTALIDSLQERVRAAEAAAEEARQEAERLQTLMEEAEADRYEARADLAEARQERDDEHEAGMAIAKKHAAAEARIGELEAALRELAQGVHERDRHKGYAQITAESFMDCRMNNCQRAAMALQPTTEAALD